MPIDQFRQHHLFTIITNEWKKSYFARISRGEKRQSIVRKKITKPNLKKKSRFESKYVFFSKKPRWDEKWPWFHFRFAYLKIGLNIFLCNWKPDSVDYWGNIAERCWGSAENWDHSLVWLSQNNKLTLAPHRNELRAINRPQVEEGYALLENF